MRTNFYPKRQFDPTAAAGGVFPWGAVAQAGTGFLQSIIGGINEKAAMKKLDRLKSPLYQQNGSIIDFYNRALARYGVSPTDSAMYKRQQRDIDRGVSTGLNALQDRRSGIAGASSILRAANDAKLNANVEAEQEKNRRFNELGTAANLKAGEDRMAFEVNEMQPFERKYNLLAQRAGANAQTVNSGLSNIFGGFQSYDKARLLRNSQPKTTPVTG